MFKPEGICTDVIKKLEEFIVKSRGKNEPTSSGTMLFESFDVSKMDRLFKDASCIKTNASKQPTLDGGWKYNGSTTYDFIYTLTEDNKILVIKQIGNLLDSSAPVKVTFRMYPNASDYVVNVSNGLDENGYMSLKTREGNQVNCYSFERPDSDLSVFNGIRLNKVLKSVNIEQLIQEHKDHTKGI